jgi:hypothetical protein
MWTLFAIRSFKIDCCAKRALTARYALDALDSRWTLNPLISRFSIHIGRHTRHTLRSTNPRRTGDVAVLPGLAILPKAHPLAGLDLEILLHGEMVLFGRRHAALKSTEAVMLDIQCRSTTHAGGSQDLRQTIEPPLPERIQRGLARNRIVNRQVCIRRRGEEIRHLEGSYVELEIQRAQAKPRVAAVPEV